MFDLRETRHQPLFPGQWHRSTGLVAVKGVNTAYIIFYYHAVARIDSSSYKYRPFDLCESRTFQFNLESSILFTMAGKQLYLPDILAHWPWPRTINPYYRDVQAESDAWFKGFNAFTEKSQYAFDMCDFGRLASLAYPWASRGL
jgi:hypothetical protein